MMMEKAPAWVSEKNHQLVDGRKVFEFHDGLQPSRHERKPLPLQTHFILERLMLAKDYA
jgi:hypothetical protein